jgi:hypothetical protein
MWFGFQDVDYRWAIWIFGAIFFLGILRLTLLVSATNKGRIYQIFQTLSNLEKCCAEFPYPF